MKRSIKHLNRIACLFLLLLLLLVALPPAAQAEDLSLPRVVDEANLLSAEEEAQLSQHIQQIITEYRFDAVIVTTPGTEGQSVQTFAHDYYDYGGYGLGPEGDGLLLLISMEARDWYISTTGYGITAFTDYGIQRIGEDMLSPLSSGNYYRAFDRFLGDVEQFLGQAASGQPYDVGTPFKTRTERLRNLAIVVIFSLAVALISVLAMRRSMKSARPKRKASAYIKPGSFHLTRQADLYLYSTVTKKARPKPPENSGGGFGGGGSTISMGSSGRSHGGGGGKF